MGACGQDLEKTYKLGNAGFFFVPELSASVAVFYGDLYSWCLGPESNRHVLSNEGF